MANININSKVSDQFFRYKMPKLIAKVEGKGNGIKTVIVNMVEIAKALNRPPMYPTKYFGCVLGAQTNFDSKSERYIVNGAHSPEKLKELLDGFIQKYVLCQSCENPETILSVNKKKEIIHTKCMACGHAGTIPITPSDRVGPYIIKNPPPKPTSVTAPTAAAGSSSHHALNSDDIKKLDGDDDDDEDWGEETDESAVRKRAENALSAGAMNIMLNDDLEKTEEQRMTIFYDFVQSKLETDLKTLDNQKAIKREADRLDLSDKAVIVLCELLLSGNLIQKLKSYESLFIKFTEDKPRAQRYLLRGIGLSILADKATLLPKTSNILKRLYDADLVDEDAFHEWYKKGTSKKKSKSDDSAEIYENASEFMNWLQDASTEESDDDGEDDSKVDIDFDDRIVGDAIKVEEEVKEPNVSTSSSKTAASNKQTTSPSKQDSEDEIDIDAI